MTGSAEGEPLDIVPVQTPDGGYTLAALPEGCDLFIPRRARTVEHVRAILDQAADWYRPPDYWRGGATE